MAVQTGLRTRHVMTVPFAVDCRNLLESQSSDFLTCTLNLFIRKLGLLLRILTNQKKSETFHLSPWTDARDKVVVVFGGNLAKFLSPSYVVLHNLQFRISKLQLICFLK